MGLPICVAQSVVFQLVDEHGEVIERAIDPVGVWTRAIGSLSPEDLRLLARVDPYDDTLFELNELDQLEGEISTIRRTARGEDAVFFGRVQDMIKRARTAPRFKINFVGD